MELTKREKMLHVFTVLNGVNNFAFTGTFLMLHVTCCLYTVAMSCRRLEHSRLILGNHISLMIKQLPCKVDL